MSKTKEREKSQIKHEVMNKEVLMSAISSPKDSIGRSDIQGVVKIVRYNSSGSSDETLRDDNKFSEDDSAAVKIFMGRETSYKVKAMRGGHFYNPLEDGFQYGLNKRDRTNNEAMFIFKSVGKSSFENYIQFLLTRQNSRLTQAEREN